MPTCMSLKIKGRLDKRISIERQHGKFHSPENTAASKAEYASTVLTARLFPCKEQLGMQSTEAFERTHPTLTVIIPVCRATYLAAAVESVFAQSHQPDTVIVVDDGSPDREALDQVMCRWGD